MTGTTLMVDTLFNALVLLLLPVSTTSVRVNTRAPAVGALMLVFWYWMAVTKVSAAALMMPAALVKTTVAVPLATATV